jgi:hypothetical protein
MGTAIHAGLQALYSPAKLGEPEILTTAEAIVAFVESLRNAVSESDYDIMKIDQLEELGRQMLTNYVAHAAERDKNWAVVYAEVPFSVPIPLTLASVKAYDDISFIVDAETGISYLAQIVYDPVSGSRVSRIIKFEGQLDIIFRHKTSGGLWIWDHKTRAHVQPDSFDWFELEPQVNTYYWVGYKALGLNIEGVLYNYLAKMTPKPPKLTYGGTALSLDKAQSTSKKLYVQAIKDNGFDPAKYVEFLSTYKEPTYFHREMVYRDPSDLELIERDLAFTVRDMIGAEDEIYPNPSEFNCKNCPFKFPCKIRHNGGDPIQWIDASGLYVKNKTYGVSLDNEDIFDA